MEVKIFYKSSQTPYEELTALIHEAFKERLEAGLNFGCATYTVDEYKQHTSGAYIFALYEQDSIVATVSLTPRKKWGYTVADHEYLAVSNECKGKGVASILFKSVLEFCLQQNIVCLLSTTAETAYSSIGYHKKNGFRIFKLDSFQGTKYYSWVFIRPITKFQIFNCPLFRLPLLYVSYIMCKLTKKADGTLRFKR